MDCDSGDSAFAAKGGNGKGQEIASAHVDLATAESNMAIYSNRAPWTEIQDDVRARMGLDPAENDLVAPAPSPSSTSYGLLIDGLGPESPGHFISRSKSQLSAVGVYFHITRNTVDRGKSIE